jgi:hypothetical protein
MAKDIALSGRLANWRDVSTNSGEESPALNNTMCRPRLLVQYHEACVGNVISFCKSIVTASVYMPQPKHRNIQSVVFVYEIIKFLGKTIANEGGLSSV